LSQPASAAEALKVIDNPGGGQVVYGAVAEDTPHKAMARVLRYIHGHFGDTPVVGRVYQNARGAVPNALADALVKANPERFQTVPTQNFLKGVDC
jgi:hypothetical protein